MTKTWPSHRGPRPSRGGRRTPLSPSRARVLELLRDASEPLGLAALTEVSGLHANTLREHLDGLVQAGLASRHRATPTGRGRPAWLYEAADETAQSEYAALATALAAELAASASDPAAAGAEAGERWGRRIAQSRPVDPSKPLDPRTETVTVLAGYGFAPRPGSREVVELTRCPLLDAARQYPEVVCSVHLGLVRGLISERGGDPTGTDLEPFATEDACRLHLPRTTSA